MLKKIFDYTFVSFKQRKDVDEVRDRFSQLFNQAKSQVEKALKKDEVEAVINRVIQKIQEIGPINLALIPVSTTKHDRILLSQQKEESNFIPAIELLSSGSRFPLRSPFDFHEQEPCKTATQQKTKERHFNEDSMTSALSEDFIAVPNSPKNEVQERNEEEDEDPQPNSLFYSGSFAAKEFKLLSTENLEPLLSQDPTNEQLWLYYFLRV